MSQDNENKKYIDIHILYKNKKDYTKYVRILGKKFVENNKNKANYI